MDSKLIDHLMRNKRSPHGEIAVVLFEHCNLSCSFCPQNHNDTTGMESILDKLPSVRESMYRFNNVGKQLITLNIQGGELFSDFVPDSVFDDYYEFARIAQDYAACMGIPMSVAWGSNLVHTKTERVLELFRRLETDVCEANLMVSYDPVSRFNRADLDSFRSNMELYGDHVKAVNITLTRPNIRKFLSGDTEYFDELYEKYFCAFDFYQLERNRAVNAPTDQDLQDMFLLLARKYPRSNPIVGLLTQDKNESLYQHTENASETISGFCDTTLSGKIFDDESVTFQRMEAKWLEDYGCLTCQYFDRCSLGPIPQNFLQPEYRTLSECWIKTVHEKAR
ncbi:hypothetical protein D3C87_755170 [compost metagenome]